PQLIYLLGRFTLLTSLIGIVVAINVTAEINCQLLYLVNQITGNAAIGLASVTFSIRTVVIWNFDKYICALILVLTLGHWSLLLHGVLIKAEWAPALGCIIVETNNKILAGSFIYTMLVDFTDMCLTAYKLVSTFPDRTSLPMIRMLYRDGILFFFIAFLANMSATIFMLVNLNPIMSVILNVPAAVASTVMASHAMRRLSTFKSRQEEDAR
ncbi:hypothetical protein BD410DRAFT_732263, partial [Rickenella mellea]